MTALGLLLYLLKLILAIAAPGVAGYLLSRLLKSSACTASTFVLSLLFIFQAVFWLQVTGLPIDYGSVLAVLLVCDCVLLIICLRRRCSLLVKLPRLRSQPVSERILTVCLIVCACVMVARCLAQPLYGWDTPFRWNFIATQLLELGHFDFYPPLQPGDFQDYFCPEGVPPLLPFAYFWLYAPLGRAIPIATGVFVVAQILVLADLCRRTANHVFGPPAGIYAVAMAAASSLLFLSCFWAQETGLTAISLVALTYFIVTAERESHPSALAIAGAAAGLGALSREYGCAFVICGLIACVATRKRLPHLTVFVVSFCIAAAPWYIRNLLVAGNPFYSQPATAPLFNVNPVHVAIMDTYPPVLGFAANLRPYVAFLIPYFLTTAPLQTLLGLPALLLHGRRTWYASANCAIVIVLWVYSVRHTAGGMVYAVRVVSPALALLSIWAAGLLAGIRSSRARTYVCVPLLAASAVFAAVQNVTMPTNAFRVHPAQWPAFAFGRQDRTDHEFLAALDAIPADARVMGHNAYQHASLHYWHKSPKPSMVPIWSPEVRFIFDTSIPARAVAQRLMRHGITHFIHSPRSKNNFYLHRFPFFQDLPRYCTLVYEAKNGRWLLLELRPGTSE